ncbi:type VI secretion system baseplate subunit TssE [Helicobacter didelphidarum]|uniref:Type VI secretion system baseplate subunit TssE n=1 Tax=Helicobacter didelphidarum TaxID=2040648 RepID=A0A3D8ICN5_9HELI|nr:type VI secretion system baseplate subunit TssE [Helicobacter didelphidarum]RDU62927.1 type VI secretion system baseplate subunit TssE [Helicobacter didelphidarum]
MSLLDRVIHNLDEQYKGVEYHENLIKDIKNHIHILLNSKLDDCMSMNALGLPDISQANLDSGEFAVFMAREIQSLLQQYENRIILLSISYDNSLSPWQLSFDIRCYFSDDRFSEFNIHITFRNNRYCEVS